jgi:MFS transporter, DHA1 family, tetracycline resistance protein
MPGPRVGRSAALGCVLVTSATPWASLQSLRRSRRLNYLALAVVCLHLTERGLESVWVLYLGSRYGFSGLQSGLTIALVGSVTALVQGCVVQRAVAAFGERRCITLGTWIATLCFLGYAFTTQPLVLFALIIIGGLAGIAGPALQSILAGSVEPGERGRLQGALTSIASLTAVLAPLSFVSGLFAYFTSDAAPFEFAGAPFLLGACLLLIANRSVSRALGSARPVLAASVSSSREPHTYRE